MEDFPPGFRFYPTEEELVSFYLNNKLEGRREDLNGVMDRIIPVLDIYDHNPWDLPQFAGELFSRDHEQWFFFIPRQESEARGGRPKRLTTTGYWKATGSPGHVYSNNRAIGIKRTMVFYKGRAPNGSKTDWKMNEYKANHVEASSSSIPAPSMLRHEFTLCRVYKNSKSLRAFDRRPLGVEMRDQTAAAANGTDEGTSFHHQNTPIAERTNSLETSSSEELGTVPSQTGGSRTMAMSIDSSEPLWDWDQLDWYYPDEN